MTIEYTLTPQDWAAFAEYHARTAPQCRRARNNVTAGGIALALGLGAVLSSRGNTVIWLLIALVFAAVWAWYWPRKFVADVRAHMIRKDRPCLRGHHTMEARTEGLRARCDIADSTIAWIGIRDVIETTDYVFVMRDALEGYVVPKRSITAGDVGQFVGEVHRLRASPSPSAEPAGIRA